MNRLNKLLDLTLIGLIAFLIFIFLLESKLVIPVWLSPLGRMHPLLLHVPIGIFAVAGLLLIFRKDFEQQAFDKIFSFLLLISAYTATLTAVFGLLLSKEGGYESVTLDWHKWLGISFALLCTWYYLFWQHRPATERSGMYLLALAFMAVAGHYGGKLTHGEDYLFEGLGRKTQETFDPDKPIFQTAIRPVFQKKCESCHNDRKVKGGLNMSTVALMLKGGKNGPLWVHGKPEKSNLMQRLLLPEEDKKHMPPQGKPQLSISEIALLTEWIAAGADTVVSFNGLAPEDTLKSMIARMHPLQRTGNVKTYTFSALGESDVEALNTPFLKVEPLASGSPALKADFYVSQKFEKEALKSLKKAKDNLVELNLNKMPVTDEDIDLLTVFGQLEKLNLNQTGITGKNLSKLFSLKNLQSLSISGCVLDARAVEEINSLKSLKELYVWNTGLPETAWEALKKDIPELRIENGYIPDPADKLRLNPPMVVNKSRLLSGDEKVTFKHSLPGVAIIIAGEGATPDSTSSDIYTKPLEISGYTSLNVMAVKEGWYASPVKSFSFFRSRVMADSAMLLTLPNREYPGKGSKTVIDGKQGDIDNFRDGSWLGYKDKQAEILVKMPAKSLYKGITVSYLIDVGNFIMPPVTIEIWAGESPDKLTKIDEKQPGQLSKFIPKQAKGLSFDLKNTYMWYKFVAKPIASLPSWHPGKGQKGWVFVDEIYFW